MGVMKNPKKSSFKMAKKTVVKKVAAPVRQSPKAKVRPQARTAAHAAKPVVKPVAQSASRPGARSAAGHTAKPAKEAKLAPAFALRVDGNGAKVLAAPVARARASAENGNQKGRGRRWVIIAAVIAGAAAALVRFGVLDNLPRLQPAAGIGPSKFGNWLAAQHAIYIDDFAKARYFLEYLSEVEAEVVVNTRRLVLFLDSGLVEEGRPVTDATNGAHRIINSIKLIRENRWRAAYNIFKNERSQMMSPFRIWSGVATERFTQTLAHIDQFQNVSDSWKNFTKGAVYAATGNPRTARRFFQRVPASFMNLGDYHLVMSFYGRFGFEKEAEELRTQWINSPGGMYMADLDIGADWSKYDSFQKMLAAGLIQNVAHHGERGFTESGLLLLRTASALGGIPESVNYYTGMYFYLAGSPVYRRYWDELSANPIFGPFIKMKEAERASSEREMAAGLKKILRDTPLFMPAILRLWRINMQNGRDFEAMRMIDRALGQDPLPDAGRAYLLRLRAHTLFMSGRLEEAENDLEVAAELTPMDAGIMGLQARVWAAQRTNLDEAYRYAVSLVKAFPSNVENWSILSMVLEVKEGWAEALEILERVGRVAEENSELFLNLGNLRLRAGDRVGAADAYRRAIALSDDGLVVRREVERKLRRVR